MPIVEPEHYDNPNASYYVPHVNDVMTELFDFRMGIMPASIPIMYKDTFNQAFDELILGLHDLKIDAEGAMDFGGGKPYKFACMIWTPSPSGYDPDLGEEYVADHANARDEINHASALFINPHKKLIQYKCSHGLHPPKPLLEGLQRAFTDYEIRIYTMRQQPPDDNSCAAYALQNLLSFAEEREITTRDPLFVRELQRPWMKAAAIAAKEYPAAHGPADYSAPRTATPGEVKNFWPFDYPLTIAALPEKRENTVILIPPRSKSPPPPERPRKPPGQGAEVIQFSKFRK